MHEFLVFFFFFICFDFLSFDIRYDNMLKEYARYMPYGLTIAGSFLQIIAAPTDIFSSTEGHSIDQILDEKRIEAIEIDSFTTGGEMIDKELRALVVDMYHLYSQLNMELEEMA